MYRSAAFLRNVHIDVSRSDVALYLNLKFGFGVRLALKTENSDEGIVFNLRLNTCGGRIMRSVLPATMVKSGAVHISVNAFVQSRALAEVMPYTEELLLGKVNKGGEFVGQGMTAPDIYGVILEYEKLLQVTLKSRDLRPISTARHTMVALVGYKSNFPPDLSRSRGGFRFGLALGFFRSDVLFGLAPIHFWRALWTTAFTPALISTHRDVSVARTVTLL